MVVVAGDVDGEGDVDVLGASPRADDITWWQKDGIHSLTEQALAGSFSGALSVYATDLDGDRELDVLDSAREADTIAWRVQAY